MANILVINGPNLNLLGKREPEHYGRQSLSDIIESLEVLADDYEVRLFNFQSNAEHEIIERIHSAMNDIDFIIFNPAAFTHTSVAIRDALSTVKIPFIEVHISNIHQREPFRNHSYFSDIAEGVIAGLGPIGYQLALAAAVEKLK
ncbi:MAG: type II 3-dehydroquinate dehydratase [Piscirickettsiaceae bacterium CG_4_9_14_3_um_filter_43_564]|nr:type II 3-dehydroquinate dehydratase [Thiomicrospira sp.]OIP96673.1 MAG: type II 3-dehydroquinate dehydratase [Thiomicrospira sp. CG2_30_44_34]PIQ05039.1 MAG: type II 3-dehydroquinate dehydratase [Piscirickettsiaceae bacterium CG18_big_fil_WC_8_21_14_2_50_44_103]PIU37955.1 MAG: type II 3-dehydroquinate dehydratase [Piscirickettsiaceae bacterium CG07_land_8_20_14_0_80_44_28]PIW58137.1 MAG: type II 3-dehydroquinate dehydratase [Piscirickettsiaceae bacterium CG12_big_fil_rev_8_21_14_0_65_44_934